MKHAILVLFLCLTIFCCQKNETILETEAIALNSVFNAVVDSVYLKSTGNKTIADSVKKKTIVIYDSLQTETPRIFDIEKRFKNVTESYFDTISANVSPRIDLSEVKKNSNFDYKYSLSMKPEYIEKKLWDSNYALPGFLVFSKICFDEQKKYGAFFCTYTNGDYLNAKYYMIFIKKLDNEWKLDLVYLQNRTY